LYQHRNIIGVLDVDSEYLSHFDEIDAAYLNKIVNLLNA
ncbi:MAG: GAF domain-containing protein, partial [Sphingobacteriales bacterium]